MRIQNSLKNILFGLSGQIISSIMGFIVRTVFIYKLGIEYLGIDGLFTSILLMLSLANLGFDTSMVYSLYRPLAEKNIIKIQALMNLYKNAYRIVGLIVLLIGLSLIPVLPSLINGEPKTDNLYTIYILFLINSVSSYYFIYYQSIIIADQRTYIISKIHSVFTIFSNCVQIVILVVFPYYILLLSFQIIFRVIENIFVAKKAIKLYPFIVENKNEKLSKVEKNKFFENLYSLFLYRISGIVINGTDNILISKFLGLEWVGMYSNYLLIILTLDTLLSYLFSSLKASIGNLYVTETGEKQYFIFRVLHFMNFWIYGLVTVVLWNLLNPFVNLWLGNQYVFSQLIVFMILLNFFTSGMQNACTTYRETTGMFVKAKYSSIVAAVINITFSLLLVRMLGISGVLLGTVISRLVTYFWFDPYLLFKYIFKRTVKEYFLRYFYFSITVGVSTYITHVFANSFVMENLINKFIILGISSILIPNIMFFVIFNKTVEFKYILNVLLGIKKGKYQKASSAY